MREIDTEIIKHIKIPAVRRDLAAKPPITLDRHNYGCCGSGDSRNPRIFPKRRVSKIPIFLAEYLQQSLSVSAARGQEAGKGAIRTDLRQNQNGAWPLSFYRDSQDHSS